MKLTSGTLNLNGIAAVGVYGTNNAIIDINAKINVSQESYGMVLIGESDLTNRDVSTLGEKGVLLYSDGNVNVKNEYGANINVAGSNSIGFYMKNGGTLVNKAEIIAHSNPSGLDAKTCLSDKAITFIRNIGFSTLDLDLDAYLVIADTGIYGNTREAVEKVAQAEENNLPHLAALGDLTEMVQKAIQDKSISEIGPLMTKAHSHLQAIGVSIEKADQLVQISLENGALGAKMSGGGLGGCIIALTQTKAQAEKISKTLTEGGAVQTWIEKL